MLNQKMWALLSLDGYGGDGSPCYTFMNVRKPRRLFAQIEAFILPWFLLNRHNNLQNKHIDNEVTHIASDAIWKI